MLAGQATGPAFLAAAAAAAATESSEPPAKMPRISTALPSMAATADSTTAAAAATPPEWNSAMVAFEGAINRLANFTGTESPDHVCAFAVRLLTNVQNEATGLQQILEFVTNANTHILGEYLAENPKLQEVVQDYLYCLHYAWACYKYTSSKRSFPSKPTDPKYGNAVKAIAVACRPIFQHKNCEMFFNMYSYMHPNEGIASIIASTIIVAQPPQKK
jgi:hypothetical protein